MKSVARILVFTAVLFGSIMAAAQAPKAPVPQAQPAPPVTPSQTVTPKQPYDSAKAQLANEKQKNFQLQYKEATEALQAQGQALQTQWQAEQKIKDDWVAQVRKDNGWDETYSYDFDRDVWTHAPKPATPKPAETQQLKK